MNAPTLPPAPFDIPPAPIARDRASSVPVVSRGDRTLDGIAWRADHLTTYHRPPADTAADVFDVIGGGL